MSRNFFDLERVLIDDVERRTGRSLAEWMAAIDEARLHGKNAVIDWLRPQGFSFANASWLERIHNNGGRPIYLEQADAMPPRDTAAERRLQSRPAQPPATPIPYTAPLKAPAPRPEPVARSEEIVAAPDLDRLAATLARAKAYRPLAEMMLRELQQNVPYLIVKADADIVRLYRPREFGLLLMTPKHLRFSLDLGEAPFASPLEKSRVPGAGPHLTHMIVLNDARQIGPELIDLAKQAADRANPPPPGAESDH